MYAFSNDPFKPLTEVERAFAAAMLSRLQRGEEKQQLTVERPLRSKCKPHRKWKPYADEVQVGPDAYVTMKRIAILTERCRLTVSGYCQTECWHSMQHPEEKRVLVFRLADVMETVARIKAARRKYYRRPTKRLAR